jgi:hypothetical protein
VCVCAGRWTGKDMQEGEGRLLMKMSVHRELMHRELKHCKLIHRESLLFQLVFKLLKGPPCGRETTRSCVHACALCVCVSSFYIAGHLQLTHPAPVNTHFNSTMFDNPTHSCPH